jgi:hypothetical protein
MNFREHIFRLLSKGTGPRGVLGTGSCGSIKRLLRRIELRTLIMEEGRDPEQGEVSKILFFLGTGMRATLRREWRREMES